MAEKDPSTTDPSSGTPSGAVADAGVAGSEATTETKPERSFTHTVERRKGSLAVIEVEVNAERLRAATDRAFTRHVRHAKIPGFRPGKAPRALYEREYGAEHLWEDAAHDVVEETYREIVQLESLSPLETPKVEITQLEQGTPLRYRATVAVRPQVTLGDYRAHGATVEPRPTTDEDVEAALASMREHQAELRPVDRAAQDGDVLTVDVDLAIEGREKRAIGRNAHIELGHEEATPGLAAGLRGVRAGEERTIELAIPEDDPDEAIRGNIGRFSVRVSAVSEKVLPPLDDAFAKGVGLQDLRALRRAVREELAHGAFHEARDDAAEKAMAHALDTSTVEVPEVLVHDELEQMVADLKDRVSRRGATFEQFLLQARKTEGELREEWRPVAERRAKSLLVLDEVARREEVTVASAELAAEMAATPLAQVDPKALRSPAVMAAMARSLRNRKALDKLLGLEGPEAEREIMRRSGGLGDEPAAPQHQLVLPESASAPGGLIVPGRPPSTARGRDAIRELLKKESG